MVSGRHLSHVVFDVIISERRLAVILAVDVGNTSTVCGVFEKNGALKKVFSFKTRNLVSAEELSATLHSFFSLYGFSFKDFSGLVIACVVPPVLKWWKELGEELFAGRVLVAEAGSVPIKTELLYPSEVGADRLVNALAGWKKYGTALIIVDFGTAITFDCVSEKGVYLGGAISPGLSISLEALFSRTAKLPKVDLSSPLESPMGKDTESAIKSGLLLGFAGLTDRLVEELSAVMSSPPRTLATGGLAPLILPYSKKVNLFDPYLTLEGLYFLWEEHRA